MASRFQKELLGLRAKIATAAQEVYDHWEQNEEGEDPEFGGGGICDKVAEAIAGVINEEISGIETFDGGQEGDDHAWVIVQRDGEAYGVDIPPGVYETGGGYNWRKREGVQIKPEHVVVFPVPLQESEPS